ncbi:SAM-dependent methyltransferase [Rhodocytophaga rosea]|uniref:SAM-dependent methyltransferase n=1 Tax=Rhodocytophaga rosea TaxID=2704465 RepID=A0A6C0GLQ4_9BACT|nr:SAM-dependent methyltransferase [Rhodocytophaga rosea]QHT68955.1 SAM-dependent methyltransferase [Rhodocytophaga rosea]
MAFELKTVVPWGRNLEEYRLMFNLTAEDLGKKIISMGDGPASFNVEMHRLGRQVISLDPIYAFPRIELAERIQQTKQEVLTQTWRNQDNFVWKHIKDMEDLEKIRMKAMTTFLSDVEAGKLEGRYIPHALPDKTPFRDEEFDMGLSSHFLILYAGLGLDFHIQAIAEMLRICKQVRIFPLLDLNAQPSIVLKGIIDFFQNQYQLKIAQVAYEFQRNGNQMLLINRKPDNFI